MSIQPVDKSILTVVMRQACRVVSLSMSSKIYFYFYGIVCFMSFLEQNTSCSVEEYMLKRAQRLKIGETALDDIVTVMTKTDHESLAAKLKARISSAPDLNGSRVGLVFVNDDLEPTTNHVELTASDDLLAIHGHITVEIDQATHAAVEAYLLDYFDDTFGGMLSEFSVLELV